MHYREAPPVKSDNVINTAQQLKNGLRQELS